MDIGLNKYSNICLEELKFQIALVEWDRYFTTAYTLITFGILIESNVANKLACVQYALTKSS